jgi:hypothetical protein
MLVQRAIDGESTYAAIEDADGKIGIANFGMRISNLIKPLWSGADFKFAIRNPQSEIQILVEAPGIEPGSKSQRRRTLHA